MIGIQPKYWTYYEYHINLSNPVPNRAYLRQVNLVMENTTSTGPRDSWTLLVNKQIGHSIKLYFKKMCISIMEDLVTDILAEARNAAQNSELGETGNSL